MGQQRLPRGRLPDHVVLQEPHARLAREPGGELRQAEPLDSEGRWPVDGDNRSPLMPGIPTFKEQGFNVHTMVASFAIHAPAGTPKPVIEYLKGLGVTSEKRSEPSSSGAAGTRC